MKLSKQVIRVASDVPSYQAALEKELAIFEKKGWKIVGRKPTGEGEVIYFVPNGISTSTWSLEVRPNPQNPDQIQYKPPEVYNARSQQPNKKIFPKSDWITHIPKHLPNWPPIPLWNSIEGQIYDVHSNPEDYGFLGGL
jgi:hypothetical protein